MTFDKNNPYNDLPLLPPAIDLESKAILKKAISANRELAREKAGNAYSKDLIELIFELPYCKISFLEQRGIAKRQTASTYLKTLENIGILESLKAGREVYYLNKRLLEILME